MRVFFIIVSIFLVSCAAGTLQNSSPVPEIEAPVSRLLYPYEPSNLCKGCHSEQYQQYEGSMHANAFTNPLFNTQYFKNVVPRALRDQSFVPEARKCVACHAPTVFMNYTGLVSTPAQANRFETGVTCDFCHTLAGIAENGDYKQNPSGKKQGPYEETGAAKHHSEYSGYIQVGEFCGRCHDATDHIGLEVKSTYYEWRESMYSKRGITCQDCHMSKEGFLRNGTAVFDRGQASYMNIGAIERKQREHEKLYNHSFPGAHSPSQLEDALNIEFKVGTRFVDANGRFPFGVVINNERSGHKMPSGSSDLRFMWLTVTATAPDGKTLPVTLQMQNSKDVDYSIAGSSPDDAAILVNDVPAGSRLYRSVLVNDAGRQSLFQHNAVKNIFDNRLEAEELRKEGYYMMLPPGFSGKVTLEARLYYKGFPSSFAHRMDIPDSPPVLVTHQKKLVSVEASHVSKGR